MARHIALLLASFAFAACDAKPQATPDTEPTSVRVTVDDSGYDPATIEAEAGQPLELVFKRTSDDGCGNEVVFVEHDIRRSLPLNEDVAVSIVPKADETIAFTCGMGMYKGKIVAKAP